MFRAVCSLLDEMADRHNAGCDWEDNRYRIIIITWLFWWNYSSDYCWNKLFSFLNLQKAADKVESHNSLSTSCGKIFLSTDCPISNLKTTMAHFIFKIYLFDCFQNLFFIFTKFFFFLYFWEVRISFSTCIVIFLMSRFFHLFTWNFFLFYFFLFLLSFLSYSISFFFTFSLFIIFLYSLFFIINIPYPPLLNFFFTVFRFYWSGKRICTIENKRSFKRNN